MLDKQKIAKYSILFIVIFGLLINLAYLTYEKSYEAGNYSKYNSEVINSYLEKNINSVSLEIARQDICSNLKGPLGRISIYYKLFFLAVLMTSISIMMLFLAIMLKRLKRTILSHLDVIIIISVVLMSFFIFAWAFILESDYHFTYCIYF